MTDILNMSIIELMDYCRSTYQTYEECSKKFLEACEIKIFIKKEVSQKEKQNRGIDRAYHLYNHNMYLLHSMDPFFDPIKLEELKHRGEYHDQ